MKRYLIPLILIALAFGLMQTQKGISDLYDVRVRQSLVSLVQWVEPSVVFIEAQTYEGHKLWTGSGVIVDPNGIVLTAAHIINGAHRFRIVLPDGREFLSDVSFSTSNSADIGFIKLNVVEDLPFSYLGNSEYLRKGESIFVMGCPFGYRYRFTITSGIVSGLERDLDGMFGEQLLLQIDAQTWSGSSGGPVFNMKGQIVGICIGVRSGYDGMSLCIPSNVIEKIMGDIKW